MSIIKLLRPKQWIKNTFVFVPLLFRGLLFDQISLFNSLYAFVLFCVAASSVYILNDIFDYEYDKSHPVKSQHRPLATGAVTITTAVILLFILYFIILIQFWLFPEVAKVLLIYMVLNLAYSAMLKHQPILDIFMISIGFVLRVIAGAVAISVQTTSWVLLIVFCLALYMATIKRRQEIVLLSSGKHHKKNPTRNVLEHYNLALLNRYAEMSGISCFVFYVLYILLFIPEITSSIIFVVFGLFRYWYVVEHHDAGESPTDVLFFDRPLLLTVFLWLATCIFGIYYI